MKYLIISFAVIFILTSAINEKAFTQIFADDFILGQAQTFNVNGPQFIPFNDTGVLLDVFDQQGCNMVTGTFSNINGPVEVGPALDFSETGPRQTLGSDPTIPIEIVALDLVGTDPITGEVLIAGMNQLGISVVPQGADSFFDVFFEIDCGSSTSTSSTSSTSGAPGSSSSGGGLTSTGGVGTTSGSVAGNASSSSSGFVGVSDITLIMNAFSFETVARNNDLNLLGSQFSVANAISNIDMSLAILNELGTRFMGSPVMFGMGAMAKSMEEKINQVKDLDSQARSALDGVKDREVSLSDSTLTTAVTNAKRLLKQARNCKRRIERKIKRLTKKSGKSGKK